MNKDLAADSVIIPDCRTFTGEGAILSPGVKDPLTGVSWICDPRSFV